MITLFITPSCTSCRKARNWLEKHNLPFVERNIFQERLTVAEIKEILSMTEEGTDEIISTRSRAYDELDIDFDALPLQQLYLVIQENPGVLKRPIIMDHKRLQIGYHEDEIRRFMPRKIRNIQLWEVQQLTM